MSHKEIIYLSFGSLSNHVSTHFWNEQQSYFTYDSPHDRHDSEEEGEPMVDHDVSFKAGLGTHGDPTYSPRALLFSTPGEFGSLRRLNPLYASMSSTLERESLSTWGTAASVLAAPALPTSEYQQHLDEGLEPATSPSRRFWSDYSRVYYHPKSLVGVGGQLMAPMPGSFNAPHADAGGDGRTVFDRFSQGYAFFADMERDDQVMDESLRWFAEDSDHLQAFQTTVDTTDAFGGLGVAYLQAVADEYPKTQQLVFAAKWGDVESDERLARVRRMNDALALVELAEVGGLVVPLRAPGQVEALSGYDGGDMSDAAALLAAHIETATLGARLRAKPEGVPQLVDRLNWRGDTRFALLGGVLDPQLAEESRGMDPIDALLASRGYGSRGPGETAAKKAERHARQLEKAWIDLSAPAALRASMLRALKRPFAASVMARNVEVANMSPTLVAVDTLMHIKEPLGRGLYAPMDFNLPSSFPRWFERDSVPVVSALYTGSTTGYMLRQARRTVSEAVDGHAPLASFGVEEGARDMLKEVREKIEDMIDAYGPDDDEADQEDEGMGTDEEYAQEAEEEEEWDL